MIATPGPEVFVGDDTAGVSISDVSRRLGVPMPTLRSWELRYDMPKRVRVSGAHRRYSADELHALRLMRDEISRGTRASLAAASVRNLLNVSPEAAEFVTGMLAASESADPGAVQTKLDNAREVLGLTACMDDVLMPAMRQVGLWWQTGRCDVEQEHLTSDAARVWMDSLVAAAPAPSNPVPVVLACGPTDTHTIGMEAMRVLLRYHGQACRFLGSRTSVLALTTAIRVTGARTVILVSHLNTGRLRAVASLRAASDQGASVFYAGNAFSSPRNRRGLPGTYLGTRLEQACTMVNDATG